jgi:hypothetical protein
MSLAQEHWPKINGNTGRKPLAGGGQAARLRNGRGESEKFLHGDRVITVFSCGSAFLLPLELDNNARS